MSAHCVSAITTSLQFLGFFILLGHSYNTENIVFFPTLGLYLCPRLIVHRRGTEGGHKRKPPASLVCRTIEITACHDVWPNSSCGNITFSIIIMRLIQIKGLS